MNHSFYNKNFISISEFSRQELEYLVKTADLLKKEPKHELLVNKIVATCFFEPSTRTRLSFETAVQRLGGRIIGFSDAQSTSIKKGETLADTARIISSYADAIIIRHFKDGAARLLSEFSSVPVINAGDGTNQHPSQTLLDLLSIYETQGTLEKLKVALAGDLKYGRTVHSLTQALSYFDCEFYFISPSVLAMPDYICEDLFNKNITFTVVDKIEDIIKEVDILYMTRVQKERIDEEDFLQIKGNFNLTAPMLHNVKNNLKILHPLPRVDEISPDVDHTPYAYYFDQAKNGVYARQAILSLVLNKNI